MTLAELKATAGRILGVDYGESRTGLAISDASRFLSSGLGNVQGGGLEKTAERILGVAAEQRAVAIVLGLPVNMNGTSGEKVEKVLRKFIDLRYRIKPYTKRLMQEAHETGSPVMRPVFYDFPQDKMAWEVQDAYMYGGDVLVAPIFESGASERAVYLPEGANWVDAESGEIHAGGQTVTVCAPIDVIPVFVKEGADVLRMIKG